MKDKSINLRLDTGTKQFLQTLAAQEGRTLSNLVQLILSKYAKEKQNAL